MGEHERHRRECGYSHQDMLRERVKAHKAWLDSMRRKHSKRKR